MPNELLMTAIENLGYMAFFVSLCLGLIGLPLPNEVVGMTGGAVVASGLLLPLPTFIMIYLGICSGLTFGYMVGRTSRNTIIRKIGKRPGINKLIETSERLTQKYGGFAISLSLLLPLLRHVTPYVVGMNQLKYVVFAAFAYSASFIWTLIYFLIGIWLGEFIPVIGENIAFYTSVAGTGVIGLGAAYLLVKRYLPKIRRQKAGRNRLDNRHGSG